MPDPHATVEKALDRFDPAKRARAQQLLDLLRARWPDPPDDPTPERPDRTTFWTDTATGDREVRYEIVPGVQVRLCKYRNHDVMLFTGPALRQRAVDLLVDRLGLDRDELEHQNRTHQVNLRLDQIDATRFVALVAELVSVRP